MFNAHIGMESHYFPDAVNRSRIEKYKDDERGKIMLYSAKTLKDFKLNGFDGEIGKVDEFYFDDNYWTIRYLIADTGTWLMNRLVLISPYALAAVNPEQKNINVTLTKKQIEESPATYHHKPVSRQYEEIYYNYFGWPVYWEGMYKWGAFSHVERDRNKSGTSARGETVQELYLRSTHDVIGHAVHATDGEIGHVEDFIIDDETWDIRYLVIDTKILWLGKKVLVSPKWVERIRWDESKVYVNLLRDTIRLSPEYSEESLLSREYETGLHQHYNRTGYWVDESK